MTTKAPSPPCTESIAASTAARSASRPSRTRALLAGIDHLPPAADALRLWVSWGYATHADSEPARPGSQHGDGCAEDPENHDMSRVRQVAAQDWQSVST